MLEENEMDSKINEIKCVYNKKEKTISLLYDYNRVESNLSDELKKIHDEARNNLKYIDIYINEEKIEFKTKYTNNERGEIRLNSFFINYSPILLSCSINVFL